jgi:cytochrome P450
VVTYEPETCSCSTARSTSDTAACCYRRSTASVFGFEEGLRFDEMTRRMKRILDLGAWPGLLIGAMQIDLGIDVLSLLLDARDEEGKPMTDAELRDELTTLLVAGHETSATALAWAVRWILEMRIVLARIFERVQLSLASPRPVRPERRSITLMPSEGLIVRIAA